MSAPLFRIYVVNLKRRADRRERMAALLERFGLRCEWLEAVDAKDISPDVLAAHLAPHMPLGPLSPGDQCCTLSHRKLWQSLAQADCDWAVVLEDDAVLAGDFALVLQGLAAVPADVDLIKIERCTYSDRVLLGPALPGPAGHSVHALFSKHSCSAGYLLRPRKAALLVAQTAKLGVPIDHFLFNPAVGGADRLQPFQLYPAVVEQLADAAGKNANSDIRSWRRMVRPKGWGLVRRELVRAVSDVAVLPRQWARMLQGARFRSVGLSEKAE